MSDPPVDQADRRYAWRVLSVTGLGMTVSFLNVSMLPVALPDMVDDLDAGPMQSDWFLLSYQLLAAVFMLPLGRVSDFVGRRVMYIGGLGVICASTVVIAMSPVPELVIAFRALQGLAAAAVIVNTTALLVDAFPPAMVPIGIGWNISIMSAAIALGPVLGGWLTVVFGWRAVFWITVPLALAGSLWSAATLRREWERPPGSLRRFDFAGTAAVVVGLGGLVLAVSMAGTSGWADPVVLTAAAAAVGGVLLFVFVERRATWPILDFGLFAQRFRAHAYGATALVTIGQGALPVVVSLYLQSAAGLSALDAGLYLTAQAAGIVLTAGLAGRLAVAVEPRVLATIGGGVVLVSLLSLAAVLAQGVQGGVLVLVLFVAGVGSGFFVTPNSAAINVGVIPTQRGMANGLRVMIDNSAMLVSSAAALVLVTLWLPSAVKPDAIGGRLDRLDAAQVSDFLDAFPVTVLVLAAFVACGLVVSATRGRTPAVDDPVLTEDPPAIGSTR